MLRVSGLPAYGPSANVHLQFPDMPQPAEGGNLDAQPSPNVTLFPEGASSGASPPEGQPSAGDERPPSPYPDVTLSIFDQDGNEVVTTFIVEHKEPELDFTLHLPTAEPGAIYVAYAELTMNDEVIQTVQVPFELKERT
jgi:hypothetical protein